MANIAIVGTGFVADYYMTTLENHPELTLIGVWDQDANRLAKFCAFYNVRPYDDLSALLNDPETTIVVNLTTPESHYAINKAALGAGKHVYCEKPLAMSFNEAEGLIKLANTKELTVCAAPANALSDAFLHVRDILNDEKIGTPRLIYVEMEDGPVFRADWQNWKSRSGAAWPGLHEFEIGCTLEHAGYGLSWLIGLFGPVVHLSAFSALTFPSKGPGTEDLSLAADFSVGCLTFENGIVARLTCGLASARDRSMTVMGDKGNLVLRDLWDNRSSVNVAADDERSFLQNVANKIEHRIGHTLPIRLTSGRRVPYSSAPRQTRLPKYPSQIDFCRGIADQLRCIETNAQPFFSGKVALHLTELVLAISAGQSDYKPKSTFDVSRNIVSG